MRAPYLINFHAWHRVGICLVLLVLVVTIIKVRQINAEKPISLTFIRYSSMPQENEETNTVLAVIAVTNHTSSSFSFEGDALVSFAAPLNAQLSPREAILLTFIVDCSDPIRPRIFTKEKVSRKIELHCRLLPSFGWRGRTEQLFNKIGKSIAGHGFTVAIELPICTLKVEHPTH